MAIDNTVTRRAVIPTIRTSTGNTTMANTSANYSIHFVFSQIRSTISALSNIIRTKGSEAHNARGTILVRTVLYRVITRQGTKGNTAETSLQLLVAAL